MTLGTLLILSALALVVIIFGSGYYFRWVFGRLVMDKLRDLDTVRGTRLAPPEWQKAYHKRIEQGQYSEAHWQAQRRRNLKKLAALRRFAGKTNLMDGENTREGVISELDQIKAEWEALAPGEPL